MGFFHCMIVFSQTLCYNFFMKNKRYQVFNIIALVLGIFICIFGLSKIVYYSSHRPLGVVDYREINNYLFCFIPIILLFISATIYHKKRKLRILTIILYCVNILIFVLYSRYYILQAIQVFTSELWLPNNVDYFTSLFESIFGSLFSLYLISTFIYMIATKYFKRG